MAKTKDELLEEAKSLGIDVGNPDNTTVEQLKKDIADAKSDGGGDQNEVEALRAEVERLKQEKENAEAEARVANQRAQEAQEPGSSDQLYVNKPGGVIVHLTDGSQRTLGYGEVIPLAELHENQLEFVPDFASDEPRPVDPNEQVSAAHRSALLADSGQVNSTSSSVPPNYDELDEDGAIALMRLLADRPEQQARVVIREQLNQGRERVLDAAGPLARESARRQIEQADADALLREHAASHAAANLEPLSEREVDPAFPQQIASERPGGAIAVPAPTSGS